jgi:hypothetical protein
MYLHTIKKEVYKRNPFHLLIPQLVLYNKNMRILCSHKINRRPRLAFEQSRADDDEDERLQFRPLPQKGDAEEAGRQSPYNQQTQRARPYKDEGRGGARMGVVRG